MPDLIGLLAHRYSLPLTTPAGIEQAELDLLGMLGKQRKINTLAIPGRTEWIRLADPYGINTLGHSHSLENPNVRCLCRPNKMWGQQAGCRRARVLLPKPRTS